MLVVCASCRRASTPARSGAPRVVSFSPAITTILFDMGLGQYVVGVTTYCQPPAGQRRAVVGDAFSIDSQRILAVRPTVIFTQSSPEKFKGVRDIDPSVRVVQLRLERLADVPAAIRRIGEVLGQEALAAKAARRFTAELESVRRRVAGRPRPRVLFVMGTDRPTAAGDDNFVADLIRTAGGLNAGADIPGKTRWRRTHIDAIVKAAPDVLICQSLSRGQSERARRYWLDWKELPAARTGRVFVVTDRGWTIPSTRLADLAGELAGMIHSTHRAASAPSRSLLLAWVHRLLAAGLVGAALAAAGMALQGLLRNPLAEPYVLGISSGAGVGVLLGLAVSAWTALPGWLSTPVLAFVGAIITCAVVYGIAQRRGRLDPYALILSGVIVNSFNAAIMLTIYLYVDPHRIADFAHWAMGRLPDSTDLTLLAVCGGCVLVGWAVLVLHGAAFNVLGLGDEVATATGVTVQRLRLVTFAAVGVMTAAAVALAGPVAFVGLIVPHICRMLIGPDHRLGLLVSGLVGAVFLAGAEVLCRTAGPLIGVSLIPVGILTALAGGPFFIYLLRRRFGEARA
ncbi:MAG: hypothetical protein B1H04_02090 [Planctomycetales bacterium 4484_123]|nr:MAG: hypothetical protein B1H04_02090 [Planctomycetales bacterium 4484_123]